MYSELCLIICSSLAFNNLFQFGLSQHLQHFFINIFTTGLRNKALSELSIILYLIQFYAVCAGLPPFESWPCRPSALSTCTWVTSWGYPQIPVQHVWGGSSRVSSLFHNRIALFSYKTLDLRFKGNIKGFHVNVNKKQNNEGRNELTVWFTCSLKAHLWKLGAGSLPAGLGQRSWGWWRSGPLSALSSGRRSVSWCRWNLQLFAGPCACGTFCSVPPSGKKGI